MVAATDTSDAAEAFVSDQVKAVAIAARMRTDMQDDDRRVRSDALYYACQRIDAASDSVTPEALVKEAKIYEAYIRGVPERK